MDEPGGRVSPWVEAAAVAALLAACLAPHLPRLRHASLFADDAVRVAMVRSQPASQTLFLPFNEHVAPLFDLLSRAAWTLGGGRLLGAPWAFTLAAILPLPIALILLWWIVRRATGSAAAALGALAVAGGSALYVEAVAWYSGSSFLWALAATLLTFEAASRRSLAGRVVAAIAAASAPAFSAIGLLAGPIAAGRAMSGPGGHVERLGRAIGPILGTLAYLGLCRIMRVGDAMGASVRQNLDLGPALEATARATFRVLLADLLRLRDDAPRPATGLELALGLAFLAGLAAWAIRSRRQRGLLVGALGLILGGYLATFGVRAADSGGWVLRVERYHLFPQFGLALAAGAAVASLPARTARYAALVLAVGLPALHAREVVQRGRPYRFPAQPATLATVERLEAVARREGITRSQVVATLAGARPRWIDLGVFDLSVLVGPLPDSPRLLDDRARAVLVGALSPAERAALRGDPPRAHRPPD